MAKKRKMVKMGIAAFLLVSVISGCSSGKNSDTKQQPTTSAGASSSTVSSATASSSEVNPYAEHIDLSLGFPDIQNNFSDPNDAMLKFLQDKFNITIKPVNFTWSDYGEKGKLWAASGQLPDFMFSSDMDTDLANKWAEQGITRYMPKDMSKYPNIEKLMSMPDVQGYFTDSGISFLPRPLATRAEIPNDRSLFVRKDWMQKLGYTSDPDTYDKLKTMVADFVKKNPDGRKDVAGIALNYAWIGNLFQNAAPMYGWYVKSNGKWMPSAMAPDMINFVKLMRDFYQSGLIDKDFAVPNQDADGKFAQGKAGVLLSQAKNMNQLEDKWKQYNPNVKFADAVGIIKPVPAADGSQYLFSYYSFWSGTVIKADVDDKKMDRILSLYDYLLSPEGRKLSMYGFEGTDWKMDGDQLVITRAKDATGNIPALGKKYPSADLFASLAAWVGYEGNIYGNKDHPGVSDYAFDTRTKYEQDMLATGKTLGLNWKVNAFVSTVPRTVAKVDVNAELTKIMTSRDNDVEKQWNAVVKKIEQNEKEVMDQVNTKFKDEN
ncbi:MAG: putative aldouronate transport system substrate-binding protein [Cohnella sp.]|nr:putative aldouronate transport system substrate-binding protein [Cohnella sp.]